MRILLYHEVVAGEPQDIHAVSQEQFRGQLRWLNDAGYQIVPLPDQLLVSPPASRPIRPKTVAITFDDGYHDNYTMAWPVLAEMQMSATIFLVAGLVGETSTWRSGTNRLAPLLTWNQVIEMSNAGITFGAHTMSHIDLTSSDLAALPRELKESRLIIEKALNRPVKLMAYPFSRFTPTVKLAVRQAGYQIACSCPTSYVGAANDDAYDLRRITVLASDGLSDFGAKVNGSLGLRLKRYRQLAGEWRRRLLTQMARRHSQN